MRWLTRCVLPGVLTIAFAPTTTLAQTGEAPRDRPAATWDKVDALQASGDVTVHLTSGERRRYLLSAATPDTLRLVSSTGAVNVVPKSSIARVERRYDDPTSNGLGIGLAVGAAAGLGLVASMYASCDAGCEAPAEGPTYLMGIGTGAAIGAVTGWLIDKAHKGKELVYVAPVISNGRKGVAVSLRY